MQAWVVGPGGGDDAAAMLAEARADGVPVVVDADALAHVGDASADWVLTPHAGELAAMLGAERADVEAAPLEHARDAARRWRCVVLLKGHHTLVAAPDGRVRVTTTGVPWLATAGAGDVLAGLVGSLLAAGLEPYDAASVGSWLHGAAATQAAAGGPLTASRVAVQIPQVVRETLAGTGMIGAMTDPACRDRGRPRCHPAQRADPARPRAGRRPRAADGRGQGRRLRARHGRGGRAARDAGADWLGVATIDEALALRAAGDRGPLLCWLSAPGDDFAAAVAAGVEVTAYTRRGARRDRRGVGGAHVQLKVDTGLSRGGAPRAEWASLFAAAAAHEAPDGSGSPASGRTSWPATSPAHPTNDAQEAAFREALALAAEAGLRPRGPPPRQLRRRDPAPVVPLRPGPLRHRDLRPRPGSRRRPRGSACARR